MNFELSMKGVPLRGSQTEEIIITENYEENFAKLLKEILRLYKENRFYNGYICINSINLYLNSEPVEKWIEKINGVNRGLYLHKYSLSDDIYSGLFCKIEHIFDFNFKFKESIKVKITKDSKSDTLEVYIY